MNRRIKLDVVMTSGAVVRLHVIEYTVSRDGTGRITKFDWVVRTRSRRRPLAISVSNIDAVVRVSP